MRWAIRGLIEGFYGRPWSWSERVDVMRWCHQRGMTHYVYAPKDDPKHRQRWRDPYDGGELDGFGRLVEQGGLGVGFGVAPGLSIDVRSDDDRAALAAKVDSVVERGVELICLALDDIPARPGLGADHAELTSWLRDHLGERAGLVVVPTKYLGTARTPYLEALAAGVPADVAVAWTGTSVVNDTVTAAEARARADSLDGRPPLLWDNFPVNDGVMADRLHLGPLWGREPSLAEECSGYLANPMVQARASKLPLASVAAFLRGEDALAAWADEAGSLRVFAEACDGAVPQALAADLVGSGGGMAWWEAAVPLAAWMESALTCAAPGLDGEADAWLTQVHVEASVALTALQLVQATLPAVELDGHGRGRVAAPDDDAALRHAFTLMAAWPRLRRAPVSVMGLRCSFRPALQQRLDGGWSLHRAALQEDENAVDALVRHAFDTLADAGETGPVTVVADGQAVPVDDQGRFQVDAGAAVLVRAGGRVTRARPATAPPLRDPRLS